MDDVVLTAPRLATWRQRIAAAIVYLLLRAIAATVRFRFEVGGRFYAFWVSRSTRGESGGYLGAGGPGYRGVRDE